MAFGKQGRTSCHEGILIAPPFPFYPPSPSAATAFTKDHSKLTLPPDTSIARVLCSIPGDSPVTTLNTRLQTKEVEYQNGNCFRYLKTPREVNQRFSIALLRSTILFRARLLPTGFELCFFIPIHQSACGILDELLISRGSFNPTSLRFGMLDESRRRRTTRKASKTTDHPPVSTYVGTDEIGRVLPKRLLAMSDLSRDGL